MHTCVSTMDGAKEQQHLDHQGGGGVAQGLSSRQWWAGSKAGAPLRWNLAKDRVGGGGGGSGEMEGTSQGQRPQRHSKGRARTHTGTNTPCKCSQAPLAPTQLPNHPLTLTAHTRKHQAAEPVIQNSMHTWPCLDMQPPVPTTEPQQHARTHNWGRRMVVAGGPVHHGLKQRRDEAHHGAAIHQGVVCIDDHTHNPRGVVRGAGQEVHGGGRRRDVRVPLR